MTQDNTPNFIRPGMTQDADPSNLPQNQPDEIEGAFAENDPATQATASFENKQPKGNPLEAPLTGHDQIDTHNRERLEPGN